MALSLLCTQLAPLARTSAGARTNRCPFRKRQSGREAGPQSLHLLLRWPGHRRRVRVARRKSGPPARSQPVQADQASLRPAMGGLAQFCATIVIAIILVLTGCMADPTERAAVEAKGTLILPDVASESRLALSRRCSWGGKLREGPPRLASYGRSRPRARRTTCRSNSPLGVVDPEAQRRA